MLESPESPTAKVALSDSSMSSSNRGESEVRLLAVSLGRRDSDLLDSQRLKVLLLVREWLGRMGHCVCTCVGGVYVRVCECMGVCVDAYNHSTSLQLILTIESKQS